MRSSKTTVWIQLILGIAAVIAVPAILIYVMRSAYQSSPEPGKIDAKSFEFLQPARASPDTSALGEEASITRVYECRKNGQVIYSGQSCGPDSIAHDIDVRGMSPRAPAPRNDEACADLQKEVSEVTALKPQTNASAERLRQLNGRMMSLGCRP